MRIPPYDRSAVTRQGRRAVTTTESQRNALIDRRRRAIEALRQLRRARSRPGHVETTN
jgi:hypothetical protein